MDFIFGNKRPPCTTCRWQLGRVFHVAWSPSESYVKEMCSAWHSYPLPLDSAPKKVRGWCFFSFLIFVLSEINHQHSKNIQKTPALQNIQKHQHNENTSQSTTETAHKNTNMQRSQHTKTPAEHSATTHRCTEWHATQNTAASPEQVIGARRKVWSAAGSKIQ